MLITPRSIAAVAYAFVLCNVVSRAAAQCSTTPAQTEGPYYRTPNPETNDIRQPGDGPLLTFHGRVVDSACNPIPYTWVAIWQADPNGVYDNAAPYDRYRSYFFTDAAGEFTLYTILPGLYPGRTRHTHIKLDAPHTNLLTTQFYFPGQPQNQSDSLYDPALEIEMTQLPDGSLDGSYQFVLPITGGCTAPTVAGDPASVSRAPGATATFSIAAMGGTPMTYRWRKNGVPLANNARISGVTTATLTITGLTCSDAGEYDCDALNACGTDASTAAVLTITDCCPADLDGSGSVDLADLALLLAEFGSGGGETGDIDGDGDVDLADLATLLSAFGANCP